MFETYRVSARSSHTCRSSSACDSKFTNIYLRSILLPTTLLRDHNHLLLAKTSTTPPVQPINSESVRIHIPPFE